jgi:hypothetical protein
MIFKGFLIIIIIGNLMCIGLYYGKLFMRHVAPKKDFRKEDIMSRVRIKAFGPFESKNEVTDHMNQFLTRSHVHYVSHTLNVTQNLNSTKHTDKQLFAGSIAFTSDLYQDEGIYED